METKSPDLVKCEATKFDSSDGEIYTAKWDGLTAERPCGEQCTVKGVNGRTFQAEGQFGGADLMIMGSLDGKNWRWVLSFTEPDVVALPRDVRFIRPEVVGGDETTKLSLVFQQRRLS